jgi:hypothetical protein
MNCNPSLFKIMVGTLKTHPARWLKVGYAVLESKG